MVVEPVLARRARRATIAGFAFDALTTVWVAEINPAIAHLREVLGDKTYESLARKDETMTTAEIVAYVYDQIDQARAELNAVSKGKDDIRGCQNFVSEMARRYDGHR